MRHALIVAGPTCSGKSGLAMALAARLGGTVINADSMQVYAELRTLTARPTPTDEASVPHALYGVRPAAEPSTAAWWRDAALAEMGRAALPILCGGTGLYLEALTRGLSPMPPIPDDVRATARRRLSEDGAAALHRELDPATAATLRPTDPQRVARAWEVLRATGRGLAGWQSAAVPAAGWRFSAILLDPPRQALRAAIATRLDAMLAGDALAEVAALMALGLDPAVPALRAHGVPEFSAYLRGGVSLQDAFARTKIVTGQYTKRQATWFRNRPPASDPAALHTIHARFEGLTQFPEREWLETLRFAQKAVDAH